MLLLSTYGFEYGGFFYLAISVMTQEFGILESYERETLKNESLGNLLGLYCIFVKMSPLFSTDNLNDSRRILFFQL